MGVEGSGHASPSPVSNRWGKPGGVGVGPSANKGAKGSTVWGASEAYSSSDAWLGARAGPDLDDSAVCFGIRVPGMAGPRNSPVPVSS